ncbi:RAB6-interacting golgin isoform X2 [Dunckerocampus dactyliophorus]|uniref:RAB6-interacting golgin isoform X2 n=1 Tax=Dunckerocampus dactyliophorus TaxID=161453 RepID=UPI002404FC9E|nr:RAB6-interacting golgin isoform X2 [Dunckerocampus dactyliophorus]
MSCEDCSRTGKNVRSPACANQDLPAGICSKGSGSEDCIASQNRDKTRLEQLQQEQKMMEERNRRKKALLAKTIAEKSKQTQAEAVKLKRIQKELQTLDDMVSNDVGILRGKIEQASWDYTAARKRYEKAETEYVMAKLDLHKKSEAKEQLTEHLCAIIQQNELRKALKLEELMHQLQLEATEEELERQKLEEEKTLASQRHETEELERKTVEGEKRESQRHGEEENGVTQSQEATVQCGPLEEERQEKDGAILPERQPMNETPPEQDLKVVPT